MKTKEELNALKEEYENMKKRLADLTEDELAQVNGGVVPTFPPKGEPQFQGIFDGSPKTIHLNIDLNLGPQEYDCSGKVD